MLTGITAVAYAELYKRKSVLVDGAETPLEEARVLLYSEPQRVSIDAELRARQWTSTIDRLRNTASAAMKFREGSTRKLASKEEHLEGARIAEAEREMFDALAEEIKRAGWAPSQYNAGEWYAIDAKGRALKPTRVRKATLEAVLAEARGASTSAPSQSTADTAQCALCGHESRDARRCRTLDAQDEPTGDWHYECANAEACALRIELGRARRDAAATARRALSAVISAGFTAGETPSAANPAEGSERVGTDRSYWLIEPATAERRSIWSVRYNGASGDDWSMSNLGDSIARRAAQSPELERAIREFVALK